VVAVSLKNIAETTPPDDPRREDIEAIERAARRGAELTNRLLSIGRQDVAREVVALDLNEVVGDSAQLLSSALPDDIVVKLDCVSQPVTVEADPRELQQVLMNLVINARDAMPSGGSLVVATAEVELVEPTEARFGAIPSGRYAMLTVRDSGEGMTDEILERIFDPFFTTKEMGKGTGLGLAVVNGIVKRAGGHLQMESAPGSGTEVRLYLPLSDDEPGPMSVLPPRVRKSATPTTVLLVEDDAAVRGATKRLLKIEGYTVIAADSGARALELIDELDDELGVLVTDVVMPEMSGRELATHLRERRPELGVVFVSGYTGDKLEDTDLTAPAVAFLQKPFTPEALNDAIDRVRGL
jgi:CheY-like chemotaxis protein